MRSRTTASSKQEFNSQVLTTFGRIDERDLQEIDGRPEFLVSQLMDHYGWPQADAEAKVNRLMERISQKPAISTKP